MGKIELVIFDFDGVIMDTEWAHAKAKKEICRRRNYSMEEDVTKSVGYSNLKFWQSVLADNGVVEDPRQLEQEQYEMVWKLLKEKHQKESPGLSKVLSTLKENRIATAICSGSHKNFILRILDDLGLASFFDWIAGGESTENLKPAPDIFLQMLQKTKMEPEQAVVIEDSASGCQAASRAEISCIGYLNQGKNTQNLDLAEWKVEELKDILQYIL